MMTHIIQTDQVARIGCMYLEEDGIIGHHQAAVPQLLLIISGEGYVKGDEDKYSQVGPGDAVFWKKDEWHETKTSAGLTAIVIESEALDPSTFLALTK